MHRLILAFALIILTSAAQAECLSSAHAVRSAHGITAWSDWRIINGRKCYMLGERHHAHERKVMHFAGRNRPSISPSDIRPRSAEHLSKHHLPAGAAKHVLRESGGCDLACHLWRVKLFQQFEDWQLEALYARAR